MKNYVVKFLLLIPLIVCFSQSNKVSIVKDNNGMKLVVDGEDFMINGVNWDYVPIGTTITDAGIWVKSDALIQTAIDSEMKLLKKMGVNAIRVYDLKPKWISYIYKKYGIYTMLNTTFGAYGLMIDKSWVSQTDYANPSSFKVLMNEAATMAKTYKNTPGLLLYMLGNENNYHLSWSSAETEDIPIDEASNPNKIKAAKALYVAFNEAAKQIKKIDSLHPVAICNGDLLYLDIIKETCKNIDVYGTNVYRGVSFGNAFIKVKKELNLPILFAEFGADAFNARDNKEDQFSQAYYNLGNWKEIYENAAGLGKAQNAIGGFTFQFSDGWWKYNQKENLDIHDTVASWSNGGYARDQINEEDKNMNEEWFGITAKGATDSNGLYELYPRAAYYVLKEAHKMNPYSQGLTLEKIDKHFAKVSIEKAIKKAKKGKIRKQNCKK